MFTFLGLLYFVVFIVLTLIAGFAIKNKSFRKFTLIVLASALVIELFVCNFYAIRSLFQKEEAFTVSADDSRFYVSGNNGEYTDKVVTGSDVTKVVISGLDTRVVSVKAVIAAVDEYTRAYTQVEFFAGDDSYSYGVRSLGSSKSLYVGSLSKDVFPIELTGNCKTFIVKFSDNENTPVEIQGITFNERIPFAFSALRLILYVAVLCGVYLLIKHPFAKKKYEDNKKSFKRAVALLLAVMMEFGCFLMVFATFGTDGLLPSKTQGNQMTKELVDAFEAGHLYLTDTPSDELLALDNPYDYSERGTKDVDAKWDHLLYNGKYYSYYGIAPVLLFFLPFHLITGYYASSALSILFFCLMGILFLSLLFMEYTDRFCRKMPLGMLTAAYITVLVSCGVWFSLCYNLFYEIAQSSGFMFTCGGFWLLMRSGIFDDTPIKKPTLAAATSMLSLAVLSRPTCAVYCVTGLIFIWIGLKKQMADDGVKKPFSKNCIKYLCAALIPFAVFGGIQCVYNFLRFGSPFDFGIQYSLTINDFTQSQFYGDFFNISFYNYILAFPVIKAEFPFIFSGFERLGVNGYYFLANENAIGIFWRALPSFGLFGIVPAFKSLKKEDRKKLLLTIIPVSILAPLAIIFSIWESGYGVRYCVDFSWQIVFAGIAILFILYKNRFDSQLRRLMEIAMPICAVLAIAVNSAMLVYYHSYDRIVYELSTRLAFFA